MKSIFTSLVVMILLSFSLYSDEWDDELGDWDFLESENNYREEVEKPTIEINYGFTSPQMNGNLERGKYKFSKQNLLDVKLGYTEFSKMFNDSIYTGTNKSEFDYLSIKHFSKDLGADLVQAPRFVKSWMIAIGEKNSYGYSLGNNFAINLFNGAESGINYFLSEGQESIDPIMEIFGKEARYAEGFEAGITFDIMNSFSINSSFERSIIHPRLMFWYASLSSLIEVASKSMAESFVAKILKSSPLAVPIVNFILQNGISYGISELRKDDVNWPVGSAQPLVYDNYKLGISIYF